MKILVTGATGFVGNNVIEEILKYKEHKIIASSKNQDKAKGFRWFEDIKYIGCDLNKSKENFFSFFEEPDLLIHLSWEGLPNFKELYHFEKNVFTNYNFIKNMVENGLHYPRHQPPNILKYLTNLPIHPIIPIRKSSN